jgi:hypothetical protein
MTQCFDFWLQEALKPAGKAVGAASAAKQLNHQI